MRRAVLCPDPERLSQLMTGEISELAAVAVERHVAECRRCAETIGSLDADNDPILLALRNPPSRNDAAVIEELVLRLQAIPEATLRQAADHTRDESDFECTLPAQPAGDVLGLSNGIADGEPWMLGSFRLLRAIGAGGMGVVYEADDIMLGRRVAVKVIRPALAGDPATRQRFLREARASAMDHEHIVGVYQAGEAEGTLFLAMPLLLGETLETRLARESKLPLADVIRIGREIANGLSAAHRRGLIHRDLKPNNVWLESPGDRVKLLDFGLARFAEGHEQLTHSSLIAGTPLYMAPEQARGEAIDCRADLFSLGCVLFRMATGMQAFAGNNVLSVLRALEMTQPPRIDTLDTALPAAFADLVERLLAKQPASRPTSAVEVMAKLSVVDLAKPVARQPASLRRQAHSYRWKAVMSLIASAGLLGLLFCLGPRLPDLVAVKRTTTDSMAASSIFHGDSRPTGPIETSPVAAVNWETFYENTFDEDELLESDERHSFGVRDGIKLEEINEQQYGTGFVHRYPLPERDFAAELRVRVRLARFSLRFRDIVQERNRSHVELLFELDGTWHLNHGIHEPFISPSREITHLLHKDKPDVPLLRDGEWTTLRIEAVGEVVSLFHEGSLVQQVTDAFTSPPDMSPPNPELIVGFWSQTKDGRARLETDYVRIWRITAPQQSLEWQSDIDEDSHNRDVARWAVSAGGTVWGGQLSGRPFIPVETPDDVLPAGFRVTSITIPSIEMLSDADLARFTKLAELRFLEISHTNLSDQGLAHLANHPKLESLNLIKTRITSAGLMHLNDVKSLRCLNLGYNPAIDDAAVEHLAAMSHLTELNLAGTKLSRRGRDALKSALPNCAVRP